MTAIIEPDPVAIRVELESQRTMRVAFSPAWAAATKRYRETVENRHLLAFMRKHFEAAYRDDTSGKGRCMVPSRDTSSACPVTVYTGRNGAEHRIKIAALPKASNDHERCRSGDGCDRVAVRGRYGKMWCEHHHVELERIAVVVQRARGRANPRNGGNDSLYTHRAA